MSRGGKKKDDSESKAVLGVLRSLEGLSCWQATGVLMRVQGALTDARDGVEVKVEPLARALEVEA